MTSDKNYETDNIDDKILNQLRGRPNGLSFGDLSEVLEKFDFSPSTLRRAVQRLETHGKIYGLQDPNLSQGRPRLIYVISPESDIFGSTETKDEIAEKQEEKESLEDDNVLRDIVSQSLGPVSKLPPKKRKEAFDKTAKLLISKEPIEMLVEFAKWLKAYYSTSVASYLADSNHREREETMENIRRLERVGSQVFYRWLGVPRNPSIDKYDSQHTGIAFRLKYSKDQGDQSALNEDELRKYLSLSVFGEHVIEIVEIDERNRPVKIGGSDASGYVVDLAKLIPWNASHRELHLLTAVGVKYDIYKQTTDKDINPDPRVLAQYERRKAIEEGYLITPDMQQEEDGMVGRIYEAAMDLRQYNKDYELLFNPGRTDLHFRDGRIFPVEHRFYDAVNYGLHGDMVRRCLRTFVNMVSMVGNEEGRVSLCGFVKRVRLDIMGPLILWFMAFGNSENESIIEMTLSEYLRSPELFDHNQIVNNLFASLSRTLSEHKGAVTFRTVRRFQSMQEEPLPNLPPTKDRDEWEGRLKEMALDRDEDYIDDAIKDYAALNARASILTFYSSRPGTFNPDNEKDILIPRIEVLLPFPWIDYNGKTQVKDKEIDLVKKVLSIMNDRQVLSIYPDDVNPFQNNNPKIFMAPKPVSEAHQYSKAVAKLYSGSLTTLLVREAKAYWMHLQSKSSG